jgi:hypothetical protein
MKWFRKMFNRDEEEYLQNISVPLSTILRWYLYDTTIEDQNKTAEMVGLTPISEEGEAKELEDSANRLKELDPILPYLESMSDITANFMTVMHANSAKKTSNIEIKEEDIESMLGIYKMIAVSSLIGSFSIALHLGLVHLSGATAEEYDTEGYFDDQF